MSDFLELLRAGLSDRYAIEREIAGGGMALVFLATDLKHRRQVAIKVLRPEVGGSLGADRFLREIEVAAKLSHPHVLPLHDSGETDGLLYYVMPFVEGESLRHRLTREKRLPLRDALRITSEVADALDYAHGRGVVHRDIKPENILLSAGHAVVTDFGIARAISAAAEDRMTGTGIALGTVQYMSPEQAVGDKSLDGRSDIYSLGCVLYEMLAGDPPFMAPTPQAVMARRFSEPSPTVTDVREGIPVAVERALSRAMAKDPSDRFATAEQFGDALSSASVSVHPAGVAARQAAQRSWRGILAPLVVLAVIVVAGVVWSLSRGRLGVGGSLAANRIAVLPFAVHGGPQIAYLSEGIVDLLSRNLEGVDELQCVDPGTVMSALRGEVKSGATIDVGTGRAILRRVGAGGFILGSVNAAGPRMRIQAALHTARGGAETGISASVEGDTTELLALVDRLSAELLVKRRPGAAHRLTQTAALTTHSLPALKAFLNAEQHLRGRALDSAIAGYQRAIAEDSTFALAYYRLAVAAGWHERHAVSSQAIASALTKRGRLTERDRRLVAAYSAFRRGAAAEAERLYRETLEDFPDDLEAEFQLGDALFQYNPLRGRPRLEARPMLDAVLAHDPGFL